MKGVPWEAGHPLRGAPLHLSTTEKGFVRNQEEEEATEEEDDSSEGCDKAKNKTKEQKTQDRENEEEREQEEEQEQEEGETERQESRPASETGSLPLPNLHVLSGADPELGPQLREAAANGENGSPSTMYPFCGPTSLSPPD